MIYINEQKVWQMPYTKELGKTPQYVTGFVTLDFSPKKCVSVYTKLTKIGIAVRRKTEGRTCSLTFLDLYESFAMEPPKWHDSFLSGKF